jgi:hypothetical protein
MAGCRPQGPCACGCCEGVERLTPDDVANPPGRAALAYRVGTHGRFLASMMAALSDPSVPALAALTKRDTSDPAVALLDLGASVADIVAFYQERIANEGYLRTATERRSVLELARLVGYRLRPGLSASGYLAFTVDKDPADPSDPSVVIPAGTKAQSVPGPGEQAQVFETAAPLDARWSWNHLAPRTLRPTVVTPTTSVLWFDGVSTGLKPGDRLALAELGVKGLAVRTVAQVTPLLDISRTQVRLVAVSPAAVLLHVVDRIDEAAAAAAKHATALGADALALRTSTLTPLRERLRQAVRRARPAPGAPPDPDRLSTALERILPNAQRELADAIVQHPDLAQWLGPVADAVQEKAPRPVTTRTLTTGVGAGDGVGDGVGDGGRVTSLRSLPVSQVLGGLLSSVRDAPRAALPSPASLAPRPKDVFAASSDVVPQLVAELVPGAGRSLYPALAGAVLTDPVAGEVERLQLKASPFGATAPRQPVLDAGGQAAGTAEWPLTGSARLAVSLLAAGRGVELARATLTVGDDSDSAEIESGTTATLVTGTVKFAMQAGTAEFTFTATDDTQRQMTLTLRGQSQVRVEVDGLTVETPSGGGTATLPLKDGIRLRASLATPEAETNLTAVTAVWERLLPPADPAQLDLDAAYDEVVPGTVVVVERAGTTLVTTATAVETVVRTDYGVSAKVTRLTLADPWLEPTDLLLSDIRSASVFCNSKAIPLGWEPDDDTVRGKAIELDGVYDGLKPGRWVIVAGERADTPDTTGVQDGELSMIVAVQQLAGGRPGDTLHTHITLVRPLAHSYTRSTVTVWGNVVKATHGETTTEPLGSGTGRAAQRFALRQKPLTYLPADTPLGAADTLELRVDGVRWYEQPDLLDGGRRDHVFATTTADDDTTTVVFGDGERGARPPTGTENVTAVYRKGIGREGNVAGNRVSQLLSRPMRVSGVVNPLPTSGGVDRDTLDQARANTPIGARSLGRLVSLADYADVARARAGIGKASARRRSEGRRSDVHLTIAAAGGAPMDTDSDAFVTLRRSLATWGDPQRPVVLALRRLSLLIISAGVRIDPDRSWDLVEPAMRGALVDAFSFDRRALGQDVLLSEVIAAVQAVPGVAYVDVDALVAVDESTPPAKLADLAKSLAGPPPARLPMPLADVDRTTGALVPAAVGVVSPTVPQTLLLREIAR